MIKKTVTYTGFDDKEHTGDFYFHLSTDELMELESSQEGGMGNFLADVVKSGDGGRIIKEFRRFIGLAYGERQEDGTFEKDEDSTRKFMRSPAFDAMFLELVTNPDSVTEFINGMVPAGMVEKLNAQAAQNSQELPWAHREPTDKELREMTSDQLREVYKRKSQQGTSQN